MPGAAKKAADEYSRGRIPPFFLPPFISEPKGERLWCGDLPF
jgi:hypothetical protein